MGWLIAGCSAQGPDPVAPDVETLRGEAHESHQLWGLWQFKADPKAGTLDVIPVRNAEMHLNALPFLEPPANVKLSIENIEFNGNTIYVDVFLSHPFTGLNQFTGFDVCGILISNGSVSGFTDPALILAGEGDTRLLNADGLTRWWNPAEFPVNDGTMFAYNDGLLGTPDSAAGFNATLNGYKYFTDYFGANEGLDTVDPSGRSEFTPGTTNVRHYTIALGSEGLVFNYAVDACWAFPQGEQPWDIDDFGPNANSPESWYVKTEVVGNTLYNTGTQSGGNLVLSVDVYDHFNAGLNSVRVESPGNFEAVTSNSPTGEGWYSSTYEIEINGAAPAENEIEILIAVESEVENYGGVLPGQKVAAYITMKVPVDDSFPYEGIFVDGDNADDPLMDGSYQHPFDTIQGGIDAAGTSGQYVYIDQCAANYEPFTVLTNTHIIGENWNGGVGWATVVQVDMWNYSYQVMNVTIEKLHFDITRNQMPGPIVTDHIGLQFGTMTDLEITRCKFTGLITNQLHSWFTRFSGVNGLEISYCEFTDIFRRGPADSNRSFLALYVTHCSNVTIHHCEFHHIGFDVPDAGSQPTTTTAIRCGPFISNLDIHNVLIYDLFDKTDGVGDYVVGMNNMRGIQCIWEDGEYFNIYNITVDDLRHADPPGSTNVNSGNVLGIYMATPHVERNWKNNIVSNLIPTDDTVIPEYTYHWGYWCEGTCVPGPSPQPMDYSAAYNVGKPMPPGEVSSDGWYYGWEDQVTWGTGCIFNHEDEDPMYDLTPGPNFYHPTNPLYAYGADDDTEMGAFGGPEGDWTPPSQE